MKIDFLTIFPEMIKPVMQSSIGGIAQEKGLVEVKIHQLREYSADKHGKTDDYPFGGGAGMVMTAQPLWDALETILPDKQSRNETKILFPTPDGPIFDQEKAEKLAAEKNLLIICGHYKGIDQRIRDHWVDEEISIGEYILTSGEIAALVIVDAIMRLLPGVLGNRESAETDSYSYPLLDCPWYTRPESFREITIPEVLLSGHHQEINDWRLEKRKEKTKQLTPKLYRRYLQQYALNRFMIKGEK
jgi:tRNA (guanine37-N1)-methyltransferase